MHFEQHVFQNGSRFRRRGNGRENTQREGIVDLCLANIQHRDVILSENPAHRCRYTGFVCSSNSDQD